MNHNTVPAGGGHQVASDSPVERFEFPTTGQTVRTVSIDDEAWFVHADACAILGIANTSQAVSYLDDDEKQQVSSNLISNEVAQGGRSPWIISESGLYSLILRSRKLEAKAFKRWVTHEVLPAIRKTGSYSVVPLHEIPTSFAEALELAAAQQRAIEAAQQQLAIAAPKAALADQFLQSEDTIYLNDLAKNLKLTRHRLIRVLRDEGVLYLDELQYRAGYEDWFEVVMDWVDQLGQYKPALKVTRLGVQKIYDLLVDGEHINPDRRTPPSRPGDNRP